MIVEHRAAKNCSSIASLPRLVYGSETPLYIYVIGTNCPLPVVVVVVVVVVVALLSLRLTSFVYL